MILYYQARAETRIKTGTIYQRQILLAGSRIKYESRPKGFFIY